MIRHVMSDGSRRKSIDGLIIPRDISESILTIIFKEGQLNDNSKTRTIKEESVLAK